MELVPASKTAVSKRRSLQVGRTARVERRRRRLSNKFVPLCVRVSALRRADVVEDDLLERHLLRDVVPEARRDEHDLAVDVEVERVKIDRGLVERVAGVDVDRAARELVGRDSGDLDVAVVLPAQLGERAERRRVELDGCLVAVRVETLALDCVLQTATGARVASEEFLVELGGPLVERGGVDDLVEAHVRDHRYTGSVDAGMVLQVLVESSSVLLGVVEDIPGLDRVGNFQGLERDQVVLRVTRLARRCK